MTIIEIFAHRPGVEEAEIIAIEGDAEIDVLLQRVCPDHHNEMELHSEGQHEPHPRKHRLHERGIKHGHHVHCRPKKQEVHLVAVTINGTQRKTHRGKNTVQHLRSIGEVPKEEVLAEFKGGQFLDLADNADVEVCGGEVFASHVKSAGSS